MIKHRAAGLLRQQANTKKKSCEQNMKNLLYMLAKKEKENKGGETPT